MIIIAIYGLDQFVVERLSHDWNKAISNLYEVNEDEVDFLAPSSMVFHNGVEQTSWNVHIEVIAPKKVQVLQSQVAEFLELSIKDVSINCSILFRYYSSDDWVSYLNPDYPRFITEENVVDIDDEEEIDEEAHEGEGEGEIFTGDIFSDFGKKD